MQLVRQGYTIRQELKRHAVEMVNTELACASGVAIPSSCTRCAVRVQLQLYKDRDRGLGQGDNPILTLQLHS
jgi:hypothetical protein